MLERLCGPNVITIEGDVLPAERSDMGKQIVADYLTLGAQFGNSVPEIDGVPEDGSRVGEIEARSPVSLIFEGAVTDFAETVKEHHLASALRASPLLSPAFDRRRRAGSLIQSRVKRVRSSRPISRSVFACAFCLG